MKARIHYWGVRFNFNGLVRLWNHKLSPMEAIPPLTESTILEVW